VFACHRLFAVDKHYNKGNIIIIIIFIIINTGLERSVYSSLYVQKQVEHN
jgi:hypothetical protein